MLKARQIGWSWLLAGVGLWKVKFSEASKGLLISQGQDEASDLLGKAKFIERNLPQFLQMKQKHPDSQFLLDFDCNDSVLKSMPSTEDAGRGTDATFIFRDELKAHPYGQQNFVSVGPCIDSGGQLVDLSTIDKLHADNHFTERINRAQAGATQTQLDSGLTVFRGGESGAVLVFGGWELRPVREEGMALKDWWDLRIQNKYTDFEKEQEYPKTIEEALRPVKARAFFDVIAVQGMMTDIIDKPLMTSEINTHNGAVAIYKYPQIGRTYVVYTDPSGGIDDPMHTVVMDAQTGEGVCEVSVKVTPDIGAQIHDELVKWYNKAQNSYEANAYAGGQFERVLKELNTPNQLPRRDPQTGNIVKDKFGWWASENWKHTRYLALEQAVRTRSIVTHSRVTHDQLERFFVPEGGKAQMPSGLHDDALDAWAGAWDNKKYAFHGEMKVTQFAYRG